jgi:hypothetical protein
MGRVSDVGRGASPQPSTNRTANLIDQIESDRRRRRHCELPGSAPRCHRLTRPRLRLTRIDIIALVGLSCRGWKSALEWTLPVGKRASPISRRTRWSPRHSLKPATRWRRMVSRASASVICGTMVVSRRASLDCSAPGGPKRRASRHSLLSGRDFARRGDRGNQLSALARSLQFQAVDQLAQLSP